MALTIKDHNYHNNRRNQVPPEIAGNLNVYFADLWIRRERLPNDWQANRALACMSSGDYEGQIILLTPDEPAARTIYSSTDPRLESAQGNPVSFAHKIRNPQGTQLPSPYQDQATLDGSGKKFALLATAIGGGIFLLLVGAVLVVILLNRERPEPGGPNDNQQTVAESTDTDRKIKDAELATRKSESNQSEVENKRPDAEAKNTRDTKAETPAEPISPTSNTVSVAGDTGFQPIDLQPLANAEQDEMTGIETGVHSFAGVGFEVGARLMQLGSTVHPKYPGEIRGISVNRAADRLHFLHASQGGAYQQRGHRAHEADGTLVGHYEVHYQDGTSESISLVYGEQLRGWWNWDKNLSAQDASLAWTGENANAKRYNISIRLYRFTWENPHPGKTIASIDFISAGAKAAPFCVAISSEGA